MPTLKDIAKLLVQKHELKQRDAEMFMTAFVDTVLDGLKTDRQVKIKGFGTFKVTAVRERESVNVNTGERVLISGHDKISFTPDAVMRDIVNKPFAQFETVILADGVNFDDMQESVEDADNEITSSEQKTEDDNVAQIIPLNTLVEPQEISPAEEKMTKDDVVKPQPEMEETVLQTETINADLQVFEQEPQQVEKDERQTEEEPQPEEPVERQDTQHIEQVAQQEETPDKMEESPHGEHYGKSRRRHRKGNDDCRKIFIVYAIVANIIFASIAFVLGYLCAANDWLGLSHGSDRVAVMPAEYVENVAPAVQQTSEQSNDSVAKMTAKEIKKTEDSTNVNDKHLQEKVGSEKNDASDKKTKQEKQQADKPVATTQSRQADQVSSTKYDEDPRVRTGAYTIIGTAATVKVRGGQTLKSISRSYLGEGMECYVEAYNGGIKEVTAGQTIKIPQLQLKKKKK